MLEYLDGKAISLLFLSSFLTFPWSAHAATYICTVEHRFSEDRSSTSAELQKFRPSVEIDEGNAGANAVVSRCSFAASRGKATCDRYPVDHVTVDKLINAKKFYVFGPQFDVQIFGSKRFLENNGRGGIATGSCKTD